MLSTQTMAYLVCGALVLVLMLLAPTPVAAQFRFETTGSYADLDTTFTEEDRYSGSIRWFLLPVDEDKGPLAEAAFLTRSSSLRYRFKDAENSAEFPNPSFDRPLPGSPDPMELVFQIIVNRETRTSTHMIDTRYVVADTSWIVGSSFSIGDGDVATNGLPSDLDNWSGALILGRYVLTNTTMSLRVDYGESEMTTNFAFEQSSVFAEIDQVGEFSSEVEVETIDISAIGEHVGTVGGYSYRLAANASYLSFEGNVETQSIITNATTGEFIADLSDTGSRRSLGTVDGWRAGLSGVWYFNDRIGLNAHYQITDLENQQSNSYGIGLSWFATKYLEVRGNYNQTDVDGPVNDLRQWGVAVRGRF